MAKNTTMEDNDRDASGLAIPAGLFIGAGIGMLIDNLVAGILLGLGIGFLGMMLYRLIKRR